MALQSIGFKFFTKIMKGSCVFCCSSCISFSPTSHLNSITGISEKRDPGPYEDSKFFDNPGKTQEFINYIKFLEFLSHVTK